MIGAAFGNESFELDQSPVHWPKLQTETHGMKIAISALDIKVARCRPQFMTLAGHDIREALGESPWERRRPSDEALSVYDEIVRQVEAQSDCEAESDSN
jgi:hypothetical protein